MQLTERDHEILMWLVHMKFMTLIQITRVFFREGCNPHRAPYRRMRKLMKAGYVTLKRVYIESKAVYVPTKAAVMLLRAQGMPYALGISKNKKKRGISREKKTIDRARQVKGLEQFAWGR